MVRARIAGLADGLFFALLALASLVELTGGIRLCLLYTSPSPRDS